MCDNVRWCTSIIGPGVCGYLEIRTVCKHKACLNSPSLPLARSLKVLLAGYLLGHEYRTNAGPFPCLAIC